MAFGNNIEKLHLQTFVIYVESPKSEVVLYKRVSTSIVTTEILTWSSIDSDEKAGMHFAHSTRNSNCRFIPSITSSRVAFWVLFHVKFRKFQKKEVPYLGRARPRGKLQLPFSLRDVKLPLKDHLLGWLSLSLVAVAEIPLSFRSFEIESLKYR